MPFGSLLGPLISGAGSLAGGLLSSNAASSAAQAQEQAAQLAAQTQLQMFNQITQQEQPFVQGGQTAINALEQALFGTGYGALGNILTPASNIYGTSPVYQPLTAQTFQQSPGYQFQFNQGINALQNAGSTKTGALSGPTLQALQGYGTGLANQDWYNANNLNLSNYLNQQYNPWLTNTNAFNQNKQTGFNFLNALTGQGQSAAANLGAAGITTGQGIAQSQLGAGNAQAAGIVGSNNALSGAINSGLTNFLSPSSGSSNINTLLSGLFGANQLNAGGFVGGDPGGSNF